MIWFVDFGTFCFLGCFDGLIASDWLFLLSILSNRIPDWGWVDFGFRCFECFQKSHSGESEVREKAPMKTFLSHSSDYSMGFLQMSVERWGMIVWPSTIMANMRLFVFTTTHMFWNIDGNISLQLQSQWWGRKAQKIRSKMTAISGASFFDSLNCLKNVGKVGFSVMLVTSWSWRNSSPRYFVSNIRHQHRCDRFQHGFKNVLLLG